MATRTQITTANVLSAEEISAVFDELLDNIKESKTRVLHTCTAHPDEQHFIESMARKDGIGVLQSVRKATMAQLLKYVIGDYINSLDIFKSRLKHLAFDINPSSCKIWAEIKEGDDDIIHELIMVESIVNSKYGDKLHYTLSTMIVEDSDRLSIPSGYIEFPLNKS